MKRYLILALVIVTALAFISLRAHKNENSNVEAEQTPVAATQDVNSSSDSASQPQTLEAVADTNFKEPKTDEVEVDEILYERNLQELFTSIPKFNKENLSDEDLHSFSPMELQEAQALAEIQKLANENKQFPSVTQKLYRDCTTDRDLAPTVRALCYFHALELSTQLKNSGEIVQLDLPIEIKKLALKLKPNGYL